MGSVFYYSAATGAIRGSCPYLELDVLHRLSLLLICSRCVASTFLCPVSVWFFLDFPTSLAKFVVGLVSPCMH